LPQTSLELFFIEGKPGTLLSKKKIALHFKFVKLYFLAQKEQAHYELLLAIKKNGYINKQRKMNHNFT